MRYNRLEMSSRRPEAGDHQHNHGTHPQVLEERGRRSVDAQIFGHSIPVIRHNTAYQQAEQIKKPHAEGNGRVHQIAKTEHGETESEKECLSVLEDWDALFQFYMWNGGIVKVEPLQASYKKNSAKTEPHEPVLEQGTKPETLRLAPSSLSVVVPADRQASRAPSTVDAERPSCRSSRGTAPWRGFPKPAAV